MLSFLFLLLFLTALVMQEAVFAFRPTVERRFKTTTTAMAWSLQTPEVPFPKSTWYDDVGNPIFRRRVYDEYDYAEFRFTTVGSNWPDYDAIQKEASAAADANVQRWKAPRIRPLQRVRNLIKSYRP
ncbi:hypothetical protein IV203_035339 [Nitzschia inconspicua]|uniref:Secreted protein n=1 Tax=Nitzschia inconspicua TaxID=303405 RepID=A0A9K3LEA1_9STRA|nr:hypothetical protein IV203_035339 [Nitzschia inconspicua]